MSNSRPSTARDPQENVAVGSGRNSITDKIWITHKARIFAEKRYRSYNAAANVLTGYYALLISIASIAGVYFDYSTRDFAFVTTSLGLAVFFLSLVLYGFNFAEKAERHRECYLRLQKLLDSGADEDELRRSYHEVITAYPNHSDKDYDALVIDRALYRNDHLTSGGEKVSPTFIMIFKHVARKLSYVLLVWALPILAPLLAFWLMVPQNG